VKRALVPLLVLVPAAGIGIWLATRAPVADAPVVPVTGATSGTADATTPTQPAPTVVEHDPLKPTPEVSAMRKSVEALGKAGTYSPEIEKELVTALGHVDQDVRGHAAWGLGRLAPESAKSIPALIHALGDPAWHVQHNAALSLHRFPRDVLEPQLLAALGDSNQARRVRVASTLIELSADHSRKVEEVLLSSYDGAETHVRVTALSAMGKLTSPSESVIAHLVGAAGSNDERVIGAAISSLGGLGPAAQSASPTLVSLASHEKQQVRQAVGGALGKFGMTSGPPLDALIKMLDDPKDGPADTAAQSLSMLNALDALEKAYLDGGPKTRKNVVTALRSATTLDERRVALITKAFDDTDWTVRLAAAAGFMGKDIEAAIPTLTRALRDDNAAVRGQAESTLRSMKLPAAKAALESKRGTP